MVFQAEMAAIDFAVRWALGKKSKLILLRIASHPSRPSGAPGPGLRFKKLGSPLCASGLVGDADHYVFRCPLTAELHLKEPFDEHRKSWFKNVRYNGQTQSKLIQAYETSNGICDRLTQG
ncbi:hypothetical protein AVEN_178495-1 [Araneus ventricosus]|uniref:Uncharacterized protein n=1 Tax=Araneus ventricosus TaxID=182803 RepID=A0A4Y2CGV8_ARAVE|nr:hypothetical protein AVEN_178495-1 [Araneus ventricosus]